MTYRSKILLLCLCLLLQAACSTKAVYPEESFAYDSLFKLRVDGDATLACESARRALLGEGYLIENANSEGVKGRKAYKSEDKQNTFIEMNIVCLPETAGSTVFATGVLSTYALKMSSSSASVGLSALGSISLPIGQSADSLVKISEETIDDQDFYRRFFAAVDNILGEMKAGKAALEPSPAAEAAPLQNTAPGVPEPVPAAVAPTSAPAQTIPVPAPEPVPAPVAPAIAPESLPPQEAPVVVPGPEPAPAPTTPAMVPEPEPTPAQEAPPTAPEQLPTPAVEPSNSISTST
jgi:hypothetical protein